MIQSMSGFGHSHRTLGEVRIQVEMRSVNHRFSEVSIRLPAEWGRLEYRIKKQIQMKFQRGRIDTYIELESGDAAGKVAEINWPLAESYRQAAELLRERWDLADFNPPVMD